MVTKRILIIEDDPSFLDVLRNVLSLEAFEVDCAGNGQEGLSQFRQTRPDLVLLDVMMPNMDGFETCRHLKHIADVPVVFLTAVTDEEKEIAGLELGAVDYLTKPISSNLLLARIKAKFNQVELREQADKPQIYQDDHLLIDLHRKRIEVQGQPIDLTKTEYQLLSYLYQHADHVRANEQILNHVWGWQQIDTSNIHVYISRLRQKLEANSKKPEYLITFRNFGYQFKKRQLDKQIYLEN